jgi:hypothetical protein
MRGASDVADELQLLTPPPPPGSNSTDPIKGALSGLDLLLSSTINSITADFNNTLLGLSPPEAIVRGLVEPLAARLNAGLGGLLTGLQGLEEAGLPALLSGTSGECLPLLLLLLLLL